MWVDVFQNRTYMYLDQQQPQTVGNDTAYRYKIRTVHLTTHCDKLTSFHYKFQ